ncbi:MAG: TraC family protein [Gammaproteobacteria bacterium]
MLVDALFGSEGGAFSRSHLYDTRRHPFSKYLRMHTYEADSETYRLVDDHYGILYELAPLPFATDKSLSSIRNLHQQSYPAGTTIQWMLYADPSIDGILNEYASTKTRDDPILRRSVDRYVDFLSQGRHGLGQLKGTPLRNFRLFLSIRSPQELDRQLVERVIEGTRGEGMAPRHTSPQALISWLSTIFNGDDHSVKPRQYDSEVPINKQVINSEQPVGYDDDYYRRQSPERIVNLEAPFRVGPWYARCITPKVYKKTISGEQTANLSGSFGEDLRQLSSPFLWTSTIMFGDIERTLHTKHQIYNNQKAVGTWQIDLNKRKKEIEWAIGASADEPFCRMINAVWIFGRSAQECHVSTARAKDIWGTYHEMQEEGHLKIPMLINALPWGLDGSDDKLVATLDRDIFVPLDSAVRLLPIQADFAAQRVRPSTILVGRKGQLGGIDIWAAKNRNFVVSAESGSGKSATVNQLVRDRYGEGDIIRLMDIGGSFQKLCALVKGRYIDVGNQEGMVVNPFQIVSEGDEDDQNYNWEAVSDIVGTMILGNAQKTPNQNSLINSAVRFAHTVDGGEQGIEHVYRYLHEFPKHAVDKDIGPAEATFKHEASMMAFNLGEWRPNGMYGRFVNGASTLDMANDEFVVLELERLARRKSLFGVITKQLVNAMSADLYLSDRERRRFYIIDEFWKMKGFELVAMVIEAYRRARKYEGSMGVVMQNLTDLRDFKNGDAICQNAHWLFMLYGKHRDAQKAGLLGYSEAQMLALEKLKVLEDMYTEIWIHGGDSVRGPMRVVMDPFSYALASTTGAEVSQYEKLVEHFEGDQLKALEAFSDQRAQYLTAKHGISNFYSS